MSSEICGRCEHFTFKGSERVAQGIGRCLGYGEKNPEKLVRWDRIGTVLFGRIKDRDMRTDREVWIAKRRKVEEAANAAAGDSAPSPRHEHDAVATSPYAHQ